MKLLKTVSLTLITTTALFSQSTMCFKENHPSMSTIESTKLDGGECKSTYSLAEMKKKGWNVEDIKISTNSQGKYNFIYILKNAESSTKSELSQALSEKQLEDKILKRIEDKKKKQEEANKAKELAGSISAGKAIYTTQCQSCHGENGERAAYNVGTALKDLSIQDIEHNIGRYTNDPQYGYGYNIIMRPIAASITSDDVKDIKAYLDSINK